MFEMEKIILVPIWGTKPFLEVSAQQDLRHCPKLLPCAISRETNDATLTK